MENAEKYSQKIIGKISYDPNKKVGDGSSGTSVFKGVYQKILEVAVKRVLSDNFATSKREIELIIKGTHPNVIRYYCSEEDDTFVYIAMELAHCSLADYIKDKQKIFNQNKSVIDKKDILLQTCKGLEYLHSQEIIHRDLKPHNILLLLENSKVRVLIADFGISKSILPGTQFSTIKGTNGWSAPELLVEFDKSKSDQAFYKPKAMDIFSLGCVFYFILTDGSHAFGDDDYTRDWKIKSGNFNVNDKLNIKEKMIIRTMIRFNPLMRPNIQDVIKFPIFWDSHKSIKFINTVSNRIESKKNMDSVEMLREICSFEREKNWFTVLGDDKLLKKLLNGRNYDKNSLIDLLCFISNKMEHFDELIQKFPDVQSIIGSTKYNFFDYIESKIPSLLPLTYISMENHKNESDYEKFYHQNSDFKLLDERREIDPHKSKSDVKEAIFLAIHGESIQGKKVAIGISGINNVVKGDLNVIAQQTNKIILPSPRENSVWFEVRKPVESFTGRKRELENLHSEVQRNLGKNEHKLTVISQVTSISGLGGIGKSEIARMYAREHGHDYDSNVIWINAETYGMLTGSFLRLAKNKLKISIRNIDDQEKDIDSIVQEVYKYFSKTKSLFIFDNAEKLRVEKEEDEGIDKFLPNFQSIDDNEPYIIITSRNKKWGKNIKVISIDTLTEEEAIEFIKKELEVSDESHGKEIRKLAQTLQYFPLALQQAVAYIKHKDEKLKNVDKQFEIIDYLKRYEENARKLLNKRFPEDCSNCYIKTTFITWEVTLEKIKQNKYGHKALEVLETIAYLSPDNIPIKIFLDLVNGDKEKLGSILQLPAQYSMVHLERGVLNIHRLVQQVIRLRLKEQQKETETIRKAIKLIKSLVEERNFDSSKYLSHAISTWNYASKDNKLISMEEFTEFSILITNNLINDSRCDEALRIYQEVLNIQESVLGGEHPDTLNTKHDIASVLDLQGKYDEALRIYQKVLNIQVNVLGGEHLSTLKTRNNIALVLDNQGKYDEALSNYQEVFNIEERVLGGEHPGTLTTRHNIATVLDKQGKYDEALSIYQKVFNIKERVLGGEHPSTLTTRHNIALVLHNQGKYEEALRNYEEVFNIQERVSGEENQYTLIARHNIALVLGNQGKYDEALRNYQEVFNIEERVLGGEHPGTLTTRHNIASVLKKQGKYDEALRNYLEVFNIQESVLGGEHPSTLTTKYHIALVLNNQGKHEEALEIYQEVFNIRQRALGGEHPDTLATRHNIALVLSNQGKYEEALEIYQEVFNIEEGVLGGEHPDTLTTRHNIASVLDKQGKYEEAFSNYQAVFNIEERVLGREHPSTLITRDNIALALDNQGKYEEALEIYQDVFNIEERVLGGEHPDTLTTRHNIALVLNNQGKYEDALEIYEEVFIIRERVLGREHPSTLITRYNIALVLNNQGKYEEALEIYQDVFNIEERVLGGEHPDTLTTRHNIGSVLDKQGKYDEALRNYQEVFNIEERVLGGEHPSTLTTRHNIASVLKNQGKYDEALEIYKEVFNIRERVLGGEHPSTLKTWNNIALVLVNQGKYDEALEIYQEVFNIRESVLGGEHPDTLNTKHDIASVLDHQGKYDKTLRNYQTDFNIEERVLGGEHPDTSATRERLTSIKRAIVGCSVV